MKENIEKKQKLGVWNEEKFRTHSQRKPLDFREGEVWWCKIGENIGVEINGKDKLSLRPVYILKKLSAMGALIIPLTSQKKIGSWYCSFFLKDRMQYAVFSQIRAISSLRLCRLLGVPNKTIQDRLRGHLLNFLS